MSEEKKNLPTEKAAKAPKAVKKEKSKTEKKPFFLIRLWRKLCKLCKDIVGEMKKVVWTPKDELKKSTKLVLVTVVAISIAIAIVDTGFSLLVNTFAGWIG